MKSQTLPPSDPACDPLPRTAKSSGAVSRASFPPAASASRCHVGHGSHKCPIFRVNSSFSSVIRRKRHPKHAAAQSHHMGLYSHICTSKCAAGSPTPAAAAAGELFCTEWALFSFFLFMINKKKEKDSLSRNKFP